MINDHELNPGRYLLTKDQWDNYLRLYFAINEFRLLYGKPLKVNSGVRSKADHEEIYSIINQRRAKAKLPALKVPRNSAHLKAAAVDIHDPIGEVYEFAESNESELVRLGLYCELKAYTPTWCHFQILPTQNRFFIP